MIVTSSFKRKGRGFVDNGKTNSEVLEDFDLETNNYRIKTLTNKKIPDEQPVASKNLRKSDFTKNLSIVLEILIIKAVLKSLSAG